MSDAMAWISKNGKVELYEFPAGLEVAIVTHGKDGRILEKKDIISWSEAENMLNYLKEKVAKHENDIKEEKALI